MNWVLVLIVCVSQSWLLTTVFGPASPIRILSEFENQIQSALSTATPLYPFRYQSIHQSLTPSADWTFPDPPNLIIDATYDLLLSAELVAKAHELSIPLLSISSICLNMDTNATNCAHLTQRRKLPALGRLISDYNWTSVSLISDATAEGKSATTALENTSNAKITAYSLPVDAPYEVVESLMAKEIKVWSSPIIVCTSQPQVCGYVLRAAYAHNMIKAGFAYVFTDPEGLVDSIDVPRNRSIGLMYVHEKGVQTATSETEYHALRVAYWVRRLAGLTDPRDAVGLVSAPGSELTSSEVWNRIETATVLVGEIADTEETFERHVVVFPGNTTIVPVIKRPLIELSIDSDLTNPTLPPNTPYADYFLAASLAFEEIRTRPDVLPTHDLIWNSVAYGATEFNETYVTKRILNWRDKLGVAHLGPIGSAVAMGTMKVMKKLGISLPIIGSANSNVALANSTVFPYYVRTIVSNGYGATVYMTMFRYFGWKQINILYGDEPYGKDFYANALQIAKEYGIEIVNKEELRIIGAGVDNTTIGNFTANLQEIIRTNVRPLLCGLLLPAPTYVFQALYDLGARMGDIIYFGDLSTDLFTTLPTENATKSMEIGMGGIHLTAATYLTSVGESAFSHFVKSYGHNPIANSCFYYDSAYALAYTLKFLIRKGLNYEDPTTFMKTLRGTQFRGCSGVVAFEPESNDRSFPGYVVVNIQGSLDNLQLIQTGFYTPTSVNVFDFKTQILWPGNATATPTAVIQNTIDCPFKERNLHNFAAGLALTSVLCILIAVVISILSFAIYFKFWRRSISPLTEKANISVDDVLLMISIVLEAFQYAALGPDFRSINEMLYALGEAFSVHLEQLVTFSSGIFWVCLDVVLVVCTAWVFLVVYVFLRFDDRLRNVFCIGNLGWISWLILPYLGNLCFLPIVSILMDVFVCDQGVGLSASDIRYQDSVLSRDCYVNCWQGDHVLYVGLSILGLVIYAPLAVLLRPLWQEFQGELHIKTAPVHFLVKTVFQILVIGLSKSLKRENIVGHGVVFLVLLALYFLFELKKERFNYGRIAHWHRMSLLSVFWLSLLALISHESGLSAGYWTLMTAIGWVGIGAFGLVRMLQRYPSMLYRAKGMDSQKLFRFAFTFRNSDTNAKFVATLNNRKRNTTSVSAATDNGNPNSKIFDFPELQ